MQDFLYGIGLNPVYGLAILAGIIGGILSIGPMMKARKIGTVACSKCGHVGKLKQTMTNKLVCADCGSSDWKPQPKAAP